MLNLFNFFFQVSVFHKRGPVTPFIFLFKKFTSMILSKGIGLINFNSLKEDIENELPWSVILIKINLKIYQSYNYRALSLSATNIFLCTVSCNFMLSIDYVITLFIFSIPIIVLRCFKYVIFILAIIKKELLSNKYYFKLIFSRISLNVQFESDK